MSGDQRCFFLVSAEHLAELYDLAVHALRALKERHHDELYRAHRTCFRAQELAVASALITLPDDEWKTGRPFRHICRWLEERFANSRHVWQVYGLDEVAAMKAHMERHGFEDLVAFGKANRRRSGHVDPAALREHYDALEGVVRAALPGVHGLVVGSLDENYREPPPPPPPPEPEPPPRPPPTPEEQADAAKVGEYFERRVRNSQRRQALPWWPELTSEGRVLLGCLPAEDGPGWLDMFRDAYGCHGRVAWMAALRRFSDAIEPALDHGLVDGRAGMVYALELISRELFRGREACEVVLLSPEEVRALRQRLDQVLEQHGGEDKFVRWLKRQERHWKIAFPRAALAAVREHVDRALETGSWLLWLPDGFDWPGEK